MLFNILQVLYLILKNDSVYIFAENFICIFYILVSQFKYTITFVADSQVSSTVKIFIKSEKNYSKCMFFTLAYAFALSNKK